MCPKSLHLSAMLDTQLTNHFARLHAIPESNFNMLEIAL